VKEGLRKVSLPPMGKGQRKLVHELAKLYHVGTVAHRVEPHRYIDLIRTPASGAPPLRLSEIVRYEEEEAAAAMGAAAGAGAAAVEGEPARGGAAVARGAAGAGAAAGQAAAAAGDAATAASGARSAAGSAAAAGQASMVGAAGAAAGWICAPLTPTVRMLGAPDPANGLAGYGVPASSPAGAEPEDRWCIHLIQVQCSEGVVRSSIRASGSGRSGLLGIEWLPERRADRAAAREAMRLEARLHFDCERAVRAAAAAVGGGVRGAFRMRGVFPSRPPAVTPPANLLQTMPPQTMPTPAIQPPAIQPQAATPGNSSTSSSAAGPAAATCDRIANATAGGSTAWETDACEGATLQQASLPRSGQANSAWEGIACEAPGSGQHTTKVWETATREAQGHRQTAGAWNSGQQTAGVWETVAGETSGRRRRGRRAGVEEPHDVWPAVGNKSSTNSTSRNSASGNSAAGNSASGNSASRNRAEGLCLDALLPQLMEMGFEEGACLRALGLARKAGDDPLLFALDWLTAHADEDG
jgi:hypothetical protein